VVAGFFGQRGTANKKKKRGGGGFAPGAAQGWGGFTASGGKTDAPGRANPQAPGVGGQQHHPFGGAFSGFGGKSPFHARAKPGRLEGGGGKPGEPNRVWIAGQGHGRGPGGGGFGQGN